jgi:hypothetical protein
MAAPETTGLNNKAQWRQHTLRSVEPLQRRYSAHPSRPENMYLDHQWVALPRNN